MLIRVVLPAPFSPSRAWTSPGRTSRVTRSLARTPGNALVMFRRERKASTGTGVLSAVPFLPANVKKVGLQEGRPPLKRYSEPMDVFLPRTLDEALDIKASRPEALPIAGGTDVMVELNFDRRRPPALLDISRLPELQQWRREDGTFFLGAGVTYSRIVRELPQ